METMAYLITWTTYGTWLPGDQRGWVDRRKYGVQNGEEKLEKYARNIMQENSVVLNREERKETKEAIETTCNYKEWRIHALGVQSNHIHVVISTNGENPLQIRKTLKGYSTRTLKKIARFSERKFFWTKGGDIKRLNSKTAVNAAIDYVSNQLLDI